MVPAMDTERGWTCPCGLCHGVRTAADAVQYVWEFALGSCAVPIVVGVMTHADGHGVSAFTYWHGEPDEPRPTRELGEFIVSCRPGAGIVPTEGDIARWSRWEAATVSPRDWLIVDGIRFRSVRATLAALRDRRPIPAEQEIAGDWDELVIDMEFRTRVQRDWPKTVEEARMHWRL
jgi:hypothetical protein